MSRAGVMRKGFTLVELLVVISIIALLLAVLMPALSRARDSARTLVSQTHVKVMGQASVMYCQGNHDTLIPERTYANWVVGTPTTGLSDNDVLTWNKLLAPYIGSDKGAKTITQGGSWQSNSGEQEKVLSVFKCPSQKDRFEFTWYLRYGLNYSFHASNLFRMVNGQSSPLFLKQTMVSRPSDRMQICDSMDTTPISGAFNNLDRNTTIKRRQEGSSLYFPDGTWYGIPGFWVYPSTNESSGWIWPVADRHRNGTNLLFLDGHVRWGKYSEVMFVKGESTGDRSKKVQMWDYNNDSYLYTK